MTQFQEKVMECYSLMARGEIKGFTVKVDDKKEFYVVDIFAHDSKNDEYYYYDIVTEEEGF